MWTIKLNDRIGASEAQPPRFDISGGPRIKGGYQLRVPDANCCKLDKLKDGTHGLHAWRTTLDLWVRSVWAGMDNILEAVRDEPEVIDASSYTRLKSEQYLVPADASELDWAYLHVSNNRLIVWESHLDTDQTKIMGECKKQCSFAVTARSAERTIRSTRTLSMHCLATSSPADSGQARGFRRPSR